VQSTHWLVRDIPRGALISGRRFALSVQESPRPTSVLKGTYGRPIPIDRDRNCRQNEVLKALSFEAQPTPSSARLWRHAGNGTACAGRTPDLTTCLAFQIDSGAALRLSDTSSTPSTKAARGPERIDGPWAPPIGSFYQEAWDGRPPLRPRAQGFDWANLLLWAKKWICPGVIPRMRNLARDSTDFKNLGQRPDAFSRLQVQDLRYDMGSLDDEWIQLNPTQRAANAVSCFALHIRTGDLRFEMLFDALSRKEKNLPSHHSRKIY